MKQRCPTQPITSQNRKRASQSRVSTARDEVRRHNTRLLVIAVTMETHLQLLYLHTGILTTFDLEQHFCQTAKNDASQSQLTYTAPC